MSFKVSSLEFPWSTATSNGPRGLSVESITVSESGREWCFVGREAQEPRKGGNYISPLGFHVCLLGLVSQSRYHTPGSSNSRTFIFPEFWRLEVCNQGVGRVGLLQAVREGAIPGLSPELVDGHFLPGSLPPLSILYACLCPNFLFL